MIKRLLFCVFLVASLFKTETGTGQMNADDFAALDILATNNFVNSVTIPGYVSMTTFSLSSLTIDSLERQGVFLTGAINNSRISRLELSGKRLANGATSILYINPGTPMALLMVGARLDFLERLDLSNNRLGAGGNIWSAANINMKNALGYLNLSNNSLAYNVLPAAFSRMPNLDTLIANGYATFPSLSYDSAVARQLNKILSAARPTTITVPSVLGLSYIDLSNTKYWEQCTQCPQNLVLNATSNPTLQQLGAELKFSQLIDAPNAINNPRLKTFKCNNCNINTITPPQGFPGLEVLELSTNQISELPPPFVVGGFPTFSYPSYGLNFLRILDLSRNRLVRKFPLHFWFGRNATVSNINIEKIHLQHNLIQEMDYAMLAQRIGQPIPITGKIPGTNTDTTITPNNANVNTPNLDLVRLDNNKLDFAALYIFNASLGIDTPLPLPLANILDTTRMGTNVTVMGDSFQNMPSTAVYYVPQDSLGVGGVRRRAPGERTDFALASQDVFVNLPRGLVNALDVTTAPPLPFLKRNGYTWYVVQPTGQVDTLVRFVPNTALGQRSFGFSNVNSANVSAYGVRNVELNANSTERFAGAKIDTFRANVNNHQLGIMTTNDNFPKLRLPARLKTLKVGECVDSLGRAVRCQEISVQYDLAEINANRGNRSVEEYKQLLRDSVGAYLKETCVCGNAELWALHDTTQQTLHLQSNQANYGSQTATTASTTRRPGLKSADMNYTLVGNVDSVSNTPNDALAYANADTSTSKTLIAHLDSGVDYDHPDLMRFLRKNLVDFQLDTVDNDSNGVVDDVIGYNFFDKNSKPSDDLGHGTQIAGILAGISSPSVHATGANTIYDNINISPIRFTNYRNEGTSYNAACAIYYAAEYHRRHNLATNERTGIDPTKGRVRVINASWGYKGQSCQLLYDAIKFAGEECNILFVTAAGNDNRTNIDQTSFYPANYKLKNILVVASIDSTLGNISAYSNLGASNVDIAALGTITRTTSIGSGAVYDNNIQGTSFATPMVARAAGILFNKYPTASTEGVKNALLASARRINAGDSMFIRSKGYLDVNAALVYMDSVMSPAQRVNCNTDQTDSSVVNHQVSVSLVGDQKQLLVYPNPVQNQLRIAFDSPSLEMIDVRILDIQGRVIIQKMFNPNNGNTPQTLEMSTENLPNGFYMLHIQQGGNQWASKIIKLSN
jgi:Subtilase family/Secretion system C-terminal sorting domain